MLLKCTYQLIPKRYISLRQGDRKKEYFVRKLIGYSSEEMYDVIADIKNYHKFVPFCTKSTILTEELDQLQANLEGWTTV
ncbi:coenzyme Q-binding protein COQ10 homolog A, mitochondrial isoform X2 [Aethina tumida]|uniref:coenzyme Q-binding protein COQ10 homolog A, mitochondrial isoform X2 n=1 Tax=Aethina tumida TaxID=116153 RepID=UPI00096B3632|nr:coenzyme Q-binding protein COQ10 homolog A, mitochondrial isoform X2 [Aethina tumida]